MHFCAWTYMYIYIAERYDTKSNVKLGGFRFQLQASYVSSHIEELWHNETACLWLTIYMMKVEKIGGFFWSLKNPTFFKHPSTCQTHTFKLSTLNVRLWIFRYIHFLCSRYLDKHQSCVNNISHDIKVLMKVIKTETFNVGFTSK